MTAHRATAISVIEFKSGMMRLAKAGHGTRLAVWRLVLAYMGADQDAQSDCSEMLRGDLSELEAHRAHGLGERAR